MKQWFQVEVRVDVFIHLLHFVYSNLDLEPLFHGHWREFGKGIFQSVTKVNCAELCIDSKNPKGCIIHYPFWTLIFHLRYCRRLLFSRYYLYNFKVSYIHILVVMDVTNQVLLECDGIVLNVMTTIYAPNVTWATYTIRTTTSQGSINRTTRPMGELLSSAFLKLIQ
jgi:hypothetical protein